MTISEKSRSWWPKLGPGFLVTAAFIGPGTVTTASRAGAEYGYALLWPLLFAIAATIILQEMAVRLGLVARLGLAEAIRESIQSQWLRRGALLLVLVAIVFGNTAYQTGNLMGAGIGLMILTGLPIETCVAFMGAGIVAVLALGGSSRLLSNTLIAIVLAMSVAFIVTAYLVRPDFLQVTKGITSFSLPEGSLVIALALIGTTIVPYNLFLHATAVKKRWPAGVDIRQALREARIDTILAISLGGLVTMAIIIVAAAVFYASGNLLSTPSDLASQLEPMFGASGKILFALGLAAAGVTSAITAPLAAGYAAAGTWPEASQRVVKGTAVAVASIGTFLAFIFGKSPQATIVCAQAANGLLLPFIAFFLLIVMNRRVLLGKHCNNWTGNIAGGIVVLIVSGLALRSFISVVW